MVKRPIHSGVLAAFVGSVAMAALLIARAAIGFAPEFSTLRALNAIMGTETAPAAGWFAFFAVFTLLWGITYGVLQPRLPGRSPTVRGLVFGLCAWLVTMLVLMPWAGFGFFAADAGLAAPLLSLVVHLIYGLVLGSFHGWLVHRHPALTADTWPGGRGH